MQEYKKSTSFLQNSGIFCENSGIFPEKWNFGKFAKNPKKTRKIVEKSILFRIRISGVPEFPGSPPKKWKKRPFFGPLFWRFFRLFSKNRRLGFFLLKLAQFFPFFEKLEKSSFQRFRNSESFFLRSAKKPKTCIFWQKRDPPQKPGFSDFSKIGWVLSTKFQLARKSTFSGTPREIPCTKFGTFSKKIFWPHIFFVREKR